MKPAAHCDECAHYEPNAEGVCRLEHRPRWYQPTWATIVNQQWGYKRRCADYQAATACPTGQRQEVA